MLNISSQIKQEINKREIQFIYLYEIEYDVDPDTLESIWLRLVAWNDANVNEPNEDNYFIYNGNQYYYFPMQHNTISQDTDGKISDVTVTVANLNRTIQYYIEKYDLIGNQCKIIQYFPNISDNDNNTITNTFRIKKVSVKQESASFTLSNGVDALALVIPGRKIYANSCRFEFGGLQCGYNKSEGETCEHTLKACIEKENSAKFGGFPGVVKDAIYI